MRRPRGVGLAALALLAWAGAALAEPSFPALSGRVVDAADVLPPAVEAELTTKLADLETTTDRQLVVATVPSLGGYEIEEYGYRLGRAWGIGREQQDDGSILLVAPTERAVRIEVGYGLEPVLTDAVSSTIIQSAIIPRFRAGDLPDGVTAGADAIIEVLRLPPEEAEQRAVAAEAQTATAAAGGGDGLPVIVVILIIIFVIFLLTRGGKKGRRIRRGAADVLIWAATNAATSGGGRSSGWSSGGGFSSGGGGFSGGGGSFGGGGASGRW